MLEKNALVLAMGTIGGDMASDAPSSREGSTGQHNLAPLRAAQESALGQQLHFLLTQVEYTFRTETTVALADLGLDVRRYSTLAFIAQGHTPTQHELAQVLHLDPSQVVTLTKDLESRGLVHRQTDARDRRAKALVITLQGQQNYRRAAAAVKQVEDRLTASVSRRDRNALKSLLGRLLPPA